MTHPTTSLHHRRDRLADAREQRAVLDRADGVPAFDERLREAGVAGLRADRVEILQLNLGKLCNMTCEHCHVDAGPDRREVMAPETIRDCLRVSRDFPSIRTVDLTGGAPEMNPGFRDLVVDVRRLGRHVIDRCNLTILLAKGFEDLPEFLAEHDVEIVASLPCYLAENTDAQRGDGAFAKSIEALRRLNDLGYGRQKSGRTLTLVYNPIGPTLPPDQGRLESAYRRRLADVHGVRFNRLFTITNMPISRFLDHLVRTGQFERYMSALVDAFNPAAIDGLMCRNTLSVGWDGRLYDCDFNQMLELGVSGSCPSDIRNLALDADAISRRPIVVGPHCYGCTAGAGSGCQGAIAERP